MVVIRGANPKKEFEWMTMWKRVDIWRFQHLNEANCRLISAHSLVYFISIAMAKHYHFGRCVIYCKRGKKLRDVNKVAKRLERQKTAPNSYARNGTKSWNLFSIYYTPITVVLRILNFFFCVHAHSIPSAVLLFGVHCTFFPCSTQWFVHNKQNL